MSKQKNTMTGRLAKLIAVSAVMIGAMGLSHQAMAGIGTTKHNLGTGGSQSNKVSAGTDEICVFCHTPHASNTAVKAPLWNKQASGATYTTYSTANSSTIDGAVAAVGSISLACLSCHDGTQAMDNIINAPGSGGLTADGGGANGLGWTWTGSPRADANGKLTGVANLGSDLSNDHPIGIRYCGGGQDSTSPTGSCTDPDFVAPKTAVINSAQVWWVDSGTSANNRDKADMILYTRPGADFSIANPAPSVECGSCHDPHSNNTTFLRISNTGSAVCLACHNK